jgi:DHA1 family tetracycline resistance protein-like MFS transporter
VRRRSPLVAVFLALAIDLLGFGLVLPLLPLYAKRYGASGLEVGLLFASFSAMQFVSAPFWGRTSDRIGRRPVFLVALGGTAASYVLFALADLTPAPLVTLLVSRTLAGLFAGSVTTAYATIADLTPPGERGRGMALIGAAFGVGFTLGPVIGGLGDAWLGAWGPGALAAAFSLAALGYVALRFPEPERRVTSGPRAPWRLGSWQRVARIPGAGVLLLLAFVAVAAFSVFESTLALLARQRIAGWDAQANGLLFAYVGLWLTVLQGVLVRRLMPRVGEVRFVRLGVLLLGLGLLAVGYAPSLGLLALAAPLPVAGFSMLTPSIASLLSRRAAAEEQGEALGVNQSVQSLSRIVGPMAGNLLLAAGLHLPYQVGAGAMAVCFLLALAFVRLPGP